MNENRPSESELEAPTRLVTVLKECSRGEIPVPAYVDRAILEVSRRQLGKSAVRKPSPFRRWILWLGAATACLLIAIVTWRLTTRSYPSFAREDLNHDGRVDILDSFALARELKNGKPASNTFDMNGDGVVDERDVNQIAARAVLLRKEIRS